MAPRYRMHAEAPVGEIPRIDVNKIPKAEGFYLGQAVFNAVCAWKEEQEAAAAQQKAGEAP